MDLHQRASMVKTHFGRGHREGLEKGREEAIVEIVRKLLQIGISVEQLSRTTGLSVDKIRSFTLTKL